MKNEIAPANQKLSPKAAEMMNPVYRTSAVFDHSNQLMRLDTLPEPLDNAKLWKARAVKLQALRAIVEAYDNTVFAHHEMMNCREDYDNYEAQCKSWEASIDMIDNLDNALGAVWSDLDYDTQKNVAQPKPLKSSELANGTEI